MPPIARLSILGFVGDALAVLIFHQNKHAFSAEISHPVRY
jgi:hypothetical protein